MKTHRSLICRIIELLLLVLMILLVAITFLQVVCRFVFKIPISWSQETVQFCFVWIIFLGSALAVKENTHLMLDMLTSRLPAAAQKVLRVLILVLILACGGVLLAGGADYCLRTWDKTMIAMPLPAWCLNISAPLCAVLLILFALERLAAELRGFGKEGPK